VLKATVIGKVKEKIVAVELTPIESVGLISNQDITATNVKEELLLQDV